MHRRNRLVFASLCAALAIVPSCSQGDNGSGDAGGAMDTSVDSPTTGQDAPAADVANVGSDAGPRMAGGSVVTHHNSPTRDGLYVAPAITRAAAASMMVDPGFTATISGPTYAHPLYYEAPTGGTSLIIVATEQNDVYALDANTGHQVWMQNIGTPVPLSALPCGNIDPVGVTGTPYLDVSSRTIYLDAMTLVGGQPKHRVHALSLDDGTSRTGWPVDVETAVPGFDSSVQNERGALLVLNGTLYVPYGGHWGDCGDYHGRVVAISTANPTMVTSWTSRIVGVGAWAPGGIASDGTDIFVTTGNNAPIPETTATWSDQNAIIRLSSTATFSLTEPDYFSPSNWQVLDMNDLDLGGSGPVLLHVAGATPSDLVVALGKDGIAYLIDRGNFGGVGGEISQVLASTREIITAASAYPVADGANVVMQARCATGAGDLVAVHVSAASPPVISTAWCATEGGHGAPIVTTTDGSAESVVWTIGAESSNTLRAFNGDTGAMISSTTVAGTFRRFVSPIYANGRFYVAGNGGVYAIIPH